MENINTSVSVFWVELLRSTLRHRACSCWLQCPPFTPALCYLNDMFLHRWIGMIPAGIISKKEKDLLSKMINTQGSLFCGQLRKSVRSPTTSAGGWQHEFQVWARATGKQTYHGELPATLTIRGGCLLACPAQRENKNKSESSTERILILLGLSKLHTKYFNSSILFIYFKY